MKVATVVGARPQFIKAAPVSTALRVAGHREVLLFRKRRVFTGKDMAQ
jgi:UDP-N-acetylglucosamine 2-epimerase